MLRKTCIISCLLGLLLFACRAHALTSERVATGLANPIFATATASRPYDLFIVERGGTIQIMDLITRQLYPQPFLSISDVQTGSELGLLGMAMDPDYAQSGYIYVYMSAVPDGDTEIRRYQVSAGDSDIADPCSMQLVLTFAQPASNHNGGWIGFGPDGYLYIASGDGGGGNDIGAGHTPGTGNAQDITDNLLGKMLRIDVNADDFPADPNRNYGIPASNPFVGVTGDDEIWAYGLRNPWRNSFDRQTGDMYIADVGQSAREEINFQAAASVGGENYGWRVMEGTLCNFSEDPLPCDDPSFTDPIFEYGHVGAPDGGRSLTGGYVYRGPDAALRSQNVYFFADYISEQIWSFRYDGSTLSDHANHTAALTPDVGAIEDIASFGQDAWGNLYVLDLTDGEIFKIIPEPTQPGDFTGDGIVDTDDLSILTGLWLDPACNYCAGLDSNDDQTITMPDFAAFAGVWMMAIP